MKIEGKRVVVTGAASGIGRALAHAFNDKGTSQVVCADINFEEAQNTADSIKGLAIKCNVGDENEIQGLVEQSTDWMGGIDIFCSNAGIMGEVGLFETSSEKWQSIWEINVMAHVYAAKAVLPQMLQVYSL